MPLNFDLRLAITQRDSAAVRRLLQSGADANGAVRGATPLSLAVYRGYLDIAEVLLLSGADPRLTSLDHLERKEPPLCSACRLGDAPMVDLLLRSSVIDVDQTDFFGKTPLWLAVKERRPDLVRKLLDRGADVNKGSRLWSESPLYLATRCRGRAAIAEMLLLAGCPADAVDLDGKSPLYWTVQNNEKKVFCGLVLSGSRLDFAANRLRSDSELGFAFYEKRLLSCAALGLDFVHDLLSPRVGVEFTVCQLPSAWASDPAFCALAEGLWDKPLSLQRLARNAVRRRLVQRWKQVDKRTLDALGLPNKIVEFIDMSDYRELSLS